MTTQECQVILAEAAKEMLTEVVNVAREYGPDNPFNFYVYADGRTIIDPPDFLQDQNTLAQAPVIEYTSMESLLSALGETVSDDVEDEDAKAEQDARVADIEERLFLLRNGEFPCQHCLSLTINGVITHEHGCEIPAKINRLVTQLREV